MLTIDDEQSIQDLYEVFFEEKTCEATALLNEIEGKVETDQASPEFILTQVEQGRDGIEAVRQALEKGKPFPVAFIDIRMPPGIDGLQTAKALRALDDRIYIVIVSAYSDYDIDEINRELGHGVLCLEKPFTQSEVVQMARMLIENWNSNRRYSLHSEIRAIQKP